jgi:hypothetical protein
MIFINAVSRRFFLIRHLPRPSPRTAEGFGPRAFGDLRVFSSPGLLLDVLAVDLMPPIVAKIELAAEGLAFLETT